MSDKSLAGILVAVVAVPGVVQCCGETPIVASAFGGLTSWIGGLSPNTALLIALITAGVFLGIREFRPRKSEPMIGLMKEKL